MAKLAPRKAKFYQWERNPEVISLDNVSRTMFIDLPYQVARKAQSLTLGGGYSISVVAQDTGKMDENKTDILREILERNQFDKLIWRNEFAMSKHGYVMNTISKSKTNEIVLGENNSESSSLSLMSKIELIDEVSAIVWKRIVWDDIAYNVREIWDTEKVVREMFNEKSQEAVNLQGFNAKVPKQYRLAETWNHGLGILPVTQFRNVEIYIDSPNDVDQLSDSYSVQAIQKSVNLTFQTEIIEQFLDRTRVFGNFNLDQVKNYRQRDLFLDEALLQQLFVSVKTGLGSGEPNQNSITAQVANLSQLVQLKEIRIQHIKDFYRGCGYSYTSETNGDNTNAGVLYDNGLDIQTTKEKRTIRQKDYGKFLLKVLVANGDIGEDEMHKWQVLFTIKENLVQAQEQIVGNELQLIQAGLQTRQRALSAIKGISEHEAQSWIEEADKEIEKQQKAEAEAVALGIGGEEGEEGQTLPPLVGGDTTPRAQKKPALN